MSCPASRFLVTPTSVAAWRIARAALPLAATMASSAFGFPNTTDPEVVALEPIVVVARPLAQPLVVVTDPRAAAQPIPAQDGAEALRAIAGFNIIRKGGTDGDPVLRGMAGSRLGIQIDGETILGGCGNRMDPPTAYVFPSAYNAVTVLKGPQSVVHGPGNSAGVVLFERLPQRLNAGETELAGAATFGSFGRHDQFGEIRIGAPSSYVELAGTRTAADDYRDGAGRAVPSAYHRWSTRAALGWTPDDDMLVELSGMLSDGTAAYADRMMDGAKFARKNVGVRIRRTALPGRLDAVEFNAFVNAVDHVMDNYSLRPFTPSAMMPGRAAANPDRLTYGARATAKFGSCCSAKSIVGADLQFNRHRNRSTGDNLARPYLAMPRVTDAEFAQFGLFGETTRTLGSTSRIIGGARADSWSLRDLRPTIATGMMSSAVNPGAGQTRRSLLPSGFARFERDLASGPTLFAGVGHVQRFPDYWEAIGKESVSSVSAFRIAAEKTTQLDLGATYRRRNFAAALSLFANRVDDFILVQSGVAKPSGMMGTRAATVARNVAARAIGGEANVMWRFTERWTLDAALAAVRGENTTDDRPLAQQPPLEGRLALSYATAHWSAGSLARFVGRQDRFAVNQGNIVGQDLGASAGFAVFSMNVTWKPTHRLQLAAGIDNLFDRTYAEHLSRAGSMVAGFPPPLLRVNEPGRQWWAKAQLAW